MGISCSAQAAAYDLNDNSSFTTNSSQSGAIRNGSSKSINKSTQSKYNKHNNKIVPIGQNPDIAATFIINNSRSKSPDAELNQILRLDLTSPTNVTNPVSLNTIEFISPSNKTKKLKLYELRQGSESENNPQPNKQNELQQRTSADKGFNLPIFEISVSGSTQPPSAHNSTANNTATNSTVITADHTSSHPTVPVQSPLQLIKSLKPKLSVLDLDPINPSATRRQRLRLVNHTSTTSARHRRAMTVVSMEEKIFNTGIAIIEDNSPEFGGRSLFSPSLPLLVCSESKQQEQQSHQQPNSPSNIQVIRSTSISKSSNAEGSTINNHNNTNKLVLPLSQRTVLSFMNEMNGVDYVKADETVGGFMYGHPQAPIAPLSTDINNVVASPLLVASSSAAEISSVNEELNIAESKNCFGYTMSVSVVAFDSRNNNATTEIDTTIVNPTNTTTPDNRNPSRDNNENLLKQPFNATTSINPRISKQLARVRRLNTTHRHHSSLSHSINSITASEAHNTSPSLMPQLAKLFIEAELQRNPAIAHNNKNVTSHHIRHASTVPAKLRGLNINYAPQPSDLAHYQTHPGLSANNNNENIILNNHYYGNSTSNISAMTGLDTQKPSTKNNLHYRLSSWLGLAIMNPQTTSVVD